MDYQYSQHQRRSRSQPRLQQQPSPAYRSSDLEYPAGNTGRRSGYYNGTSGTAASGYVGGGESRPWRSRSLENRRDWVISDDYGFPSTGPDDRYPGGAATMRYPTQHHHYSQRNYDYQPYLSVSTAPAAAAGYRGTYDGRRGIVAEGNDPYFDTAVASYSGRSIPVDSDWDALDRSLRNYREDPGTAQVVATMRRSKAQSLSPIRPTGYYSGGGGGGGTSSGGTKSRYRNLSSFFHRHSGTGSGIAAVGPQNGTSVNRNESMLRYRNDYHRNIPPTAQEEIEFGAERGMTGYYRTGGSGQQQQQQDFYGPGPGVGSAVTSGTITRGRTTTRAVTDRYGPRPQKYYKLHCCCFSFRWPPWAFEEVEPPQPMYRHT